MVVWGVLIAQFKVSSIVSRNVEMHGVVLLGLFFSFVLCCLLHLGLIQKVWSSPRSAHLCSKMFNRCFDVAFGFHVCSILQRIWVRVVCASLTIRPTCHTRLPCHKAARGAASSTCPDWRWRFRLFIGWGSWRAARRGRGARLRRGRHVLR
jgi:hypothetical protein